MFPFRPSRAATALLELAEAMLAPDAFSCPQDAAPHPHRRAAALERHRRLAPPRPEQTCASTHPRESAGSAPLTRAAQARTARVARDLR